MIMEEMENFKAIGPLLERRGIRLTEGQEAGLVRYGELLEKWSRRINLIGDKGRIYTRHILDSLMAELLPWPGGAQLIADVGSGAGLPGMPLALLHPDARVESFETVAKKVSFQQVAATELGLENFFPIRRDIGPWALSAEGGGRYQIVLARAFAPLDRLMVVAGRLLQPEGELWAFKGRALADEQSRILPAVLELFQPEPKLYHYDFTEAEMGGVIAVYRRR